MDSTDGKRIWSQNILTTLIANKTRDEEMAILRAARRTLTVFIIWLCVWNVYGWDCSIGVSAVPPVTLRFPPVRRHVTSPLCFPAQEDLSKNVFLFKGSQQHSFLLCLATVRLCVWVCVGVSVCVCILVKPYIVGPRKQELLRCRWGCWRVCIFLFGLYLYTEKDPVS